MAVWSDLLKETKDTGCTIGGFVLGYICIIVVNSECSGGACVVNTRWSMKGAHLRMVIGWVVMGGDREVR